MTKLYNKISEKEKRRMLRNNMTRAEVYLWLHLKNRKILGKRFLRQYGVGCYVVDFYCPEVRLAVEVDGATHLTQEEIAYDKDRQTEIEEVGIKFLRFTNSEIYYDIRNVTLKIKAKVKELSKK